MSTTTLDAPAKRLTRRGLTPLTGTGALVRLALRRDRVQLPIWIVVLAALPAITANAYDTLYPTAAERTSLTGTIGANPSVAVLYGPGFDLSTPGGFTAWRFGGIVAVLTALMAVFTVTRHTRAEEDSGRAELLASTVTGRYAALTAAVAVAGGVSATIGVIQATALIAAGTPTAGAWAFGLSTVACGLVFTAVAALAAQLAEYARTANGIAAAVLGAAFLVRAVGDSSTGGHSLSWLSPIGWVQQIRPFAGERWWVLALPLVTATIVAAAAYVVLPRRDLGVGILPPHPGPARGASSLGTTSALAWRLQRGALLGWTLAMVTAGAVFGSIAKGIGDLLGDSQTTRDMFERMGGSAKLVDAFLAALAGIYGMLVSLFGVQALLRMRAEETAGRIEPLLATHVGRLRWAASHLVYVFIGGAVVLLAAGAATGLTHGLRDGDVGGRVVDMVGATVAQLPAVWLVLAIGVALFGLAPHLTVATWAVALFMLMAGLFGAVLGAPQFVLDLSAFSHIPKLPGSDVTPTPFTVLGMLAIVTLVIGLAAFRRRDVG